MNNKQSIREQLEKLKAENYTLGYIEWIHGCFEFCFRRQPKEGELFTMHQRIQVHENAYHMIKLMVLEIWDEI